MTEMPDATNAIVVAKSDEGVATITLNRPRRLNAFTVAMIDGCCEALQRAANDEDVRVIVVTGAGRAFCAGADIDDLKAITERNAPGNREYLARHVQQLPLLMERIDKPLIAAVNGAARGAGFDIALMCDLRFAAESATFSQSYIELGVIPGDGGAFFLPRLVGTARALELIWTGRVIPAHEAGGLGLLNRVVADGDLQVVVAEFARDLARRPVEAVRRAKRAVHGSAGMSLASHLEMVASHMAVLYETPEYLARASELTQRLRK